MNNAYLYHREVLEGILILIIIMSNLVRKNIVVKDFYPDTHLDVDLKLISREPGRMPAGIL